MIGTTWGGGDSRVGQAPVFSCSHPGPAPPATRPSVPGCPDGRQSPRAEPAPVGESLAPGLHLGIQVHGEAWGI